MFPTFQPSSPLKVSAKSEINTRLERKGIFGKVHR
jgi:hypothetical protein